MATFARSGQLGQIEQLKIDLAQSDELLNLQQKMLDTRGKMSLNAEKLASFAEEDKKFLSRIDEALSGTWTGTVVCGSQTYMWHFVAESTDGGTMSGKKNQPPKKRKVPVLISFPELRNGTFPNKGELVEDDQYRYEVEINESLTMINGTYQNDQCRLNLSRGS